MQTADLLNWFEEIEERFHRFANASTGNLNPAEAHGWATNAQSALEAVFPAAHVCVRNWKKIQDSINWTYLNSLDLLQLFAIFHVAHNQLKEGRLCSLTDAVRVQTEGELLDQAGSLLHANHLVAATVIAAGALETHLRHLAAKCAVSIAGESSISKYNQAIAQARNPGVTVTITPSDTSQITAWAQMRNEAAHDPANFKGTNAQIDLMVRGIRDFIARTE
jgi:hypothetical protein